MRDPSEKLADPRVIARVVALIRGMLDGDSLSMSLEGESTTLYRIFDARDQLLYVGVSGRRYLDRLYEHEDGKPWWRKGHTIQLTHYSTRREALEAELFAIQAEHPPYNFLGRAKDPTRGEGRCRIQGKAAREIS
jgi:hypothetical protein